jgi:hypothetical protein
MINFIMNFLTVSRLDGDVSIDVIVLLQKPSFYGKETSLFKTFKKRLIIWGSRNNARQPPLQKVIPFDLAYVI